jgi:hypothetical protein
VVPGKAASIAGINTPRPLQARTRRRHRTPARPSRPTSRHRRFAHADRSGQAKNEGTLHAVSSARRATSPSRAGQGRQKCSKATAA